MKKITNFIIYGVLASLVASYIYDGLQSKTQATPTVVIVENPPPVQSASTGATIFSIVLIIIGIILIGGEICLYGACMGISAILCIVFIIIGSLII